MADWQQPITHLALALLAAKRGGPQALTGLLAGIARRQEETRQLAREQQQMTRQGLLDQWQHENDQAQRDNIREDNARAEAQLTLQRQQEQAGRVNRFIERAGNLAPQIAETASANPLDPSAQNEFAMRAFQMTQNEDVPSSAANAVLPNMTSLVSTRRKRQAEALYQAAEKRFNPNGDRPDWESSLTLQTEAFGAVKPIELRQFFFPTQTADGGPAPLPPSRENVATTERMALAAFARERQTTPEKLSAADLLEFRKQFAQADDRSRLDTTGTLTSAGLDAAARLYAATGQLPALGIGASNLRAQIINRAAQLGGAAGAPLDLVTNQAVWRVNTKALGQLVNYYQSTEAFSRQANKNLDSALAQSHKVPRTQSPVLNRYIQWLNGHTLTGNPELTRLETYIYAAATEYAKVASGGALSAQALTDSAYRESQKLLNAAQTPEAFQAAVEAMKQEMTNRRTSYAQTIEDLTKTIGGGTESVAPVPTGRFNPATGKVEPIR